MHDTKKQKKKKWNGKGRQKPWSYTSIIEAPVSTCGFQQEAQMPLGWCHMLLPAKGDHEGRIQHSLPEFMHMSSAMRRLNWWHPCKIQPVTAINRVYANSLHFFHKHPRTGQQDTEIICSPLLPLCPCLRWGATTSYFNSKGKRAFTKDSEGISEALQRLLDSTKRIFSNQKLKWVS